MGETGSLFFAAGLEQQAPRPLADKMRPQSLHEVVGQNHLLGEGSALRRLVDAGQFSSMIFWGPPGTGKTTVARLLAQETKLHFEQISAIFSGVAELRKIFEAAKEKRQTGLGTILFVDEIHRFNRAQQDAFLPYMENGTIILIGATTENPSFELNGALLSRARVFIFNRLADDALRSLFGRALKLIKAPVHISDQAKDMIIALADGDGRSLLGMLDDIAHTVDPDIEVNENNLSQLLSRRAPLYDKSQDGHYNLISALHKTVRGSDPDAGLYYLARMLDAGEHPLYIARRLVRMACEDIGLADPFAISLALSAKDTYDFLGSPEGELALAETVVYLALAPKSNAVYKAFGQAKEAAAKSGSLSPPKHILNAPTRFMKDQGYGRGYRYDHDEKDAISGQEYFPEEMGRQAFYKPTNFGREKMFAERLAQIKERRAQLKRQSE